jgi:hypothetical protein
MMRLLTCLAGLAALLATAPPLAAQPSSPIAGPMVVLKPADQERIKNLAASRQAGLEAAASGNAAELRAAKELLAAPAQPLDPATLEGKWRCRSIHLGGIIALTINPFFECRIFRERDTLHLEKLTGGTRRKARLVPLDERRFLLYGTSRAAGDPVLPYGADDYRDEVGILERTGKDRLRLELPTPRAFNTAKHEMIELTRQK